MYSPAVTVRRIDVLIRILSGRKTIIQDNFVRAYSSEGKVTIGDVSKELTTPNKAEYVPRKYLTVENTELKYLSQSTLRNLRWMMQKDLLGQDMFLLGRPGPSRRKIALQYLELTQRELEYVALSRDTTEADLKQRREIQSSTAKYFDQSRVVGTLLDMYIDPGQSMGPFTQLVGVPRILCSKDAIRLRSMALNDFNEHSRCTVV